MTAVRIAFNPATEPAADDQASLDMALPDSQALVHHPDGYYWLGAGGREQFGPYDTAEEALAALHHAAEDDIEPEESLPEAEEALGLSGWVDPDTGELAEATHTRLEDH